MKIQLITLLFLSGLLALFNLSASAEEKPKSPASPEEIKRPESPDSVGRLRNPHSPEEKPTAYLGVLTAQVSPELRAQFGLMEGFGLLIQEVMPDSPAKEAGLKEHDVLVSFEDQKLVNMDQLQTLVRSKKKADTVLLSIISGGETKQITIKIGERLVALNQERPHALVPSFPGMRGGEWGGGEQWRDFNEDLQRRTRAYQERLQDWNREERRGPMPQPPMFEAPSRKGGERGPSDGSPFRLGSPDEGLNGGEHRFEYRESRESANVTRSDDTGIYRLRRNDGKQIFTVKPKDGEEKSWPANNDQERAAVPEPYQSKLREMDQIRSSMRDDQGLGINGDRRPEAKRENTGNLPQPKESPPEAKESLPEAKRP
jgi:hypothetical protein